MTATGAAKRGFRLALCDAHSVAAGSRRPEIRRLVVTFAVLAGAAFAAAPAKADFIVPPNAVVNLNAGQVDLACTDLIVGGTLHVDTATMTNIRHVTIQPGGVLDGGAGTVRLGGDWTNGGAFTAAASHVEFRDLCSLSFSTLGGATTFANLSFVSAIGKTYRFTAGQTQTVGGILEIAGSASQPIQIRSTTPGTAAFLNLLSGGTQQIQHVGVTDNWATGQWLAPTLTNEGGGGNANRWFGGSPPGGISPIPTAGAGTLAALATLLGLFGAWAVQRRNRGARINGAGGRVSRRSARG
jgi:hypothetical protein